LSPSFVALSLERLTNELETWKWHHRQVPDQWELQRITTDTTTARRLVDSAQRHLASAAIISEDDPECAFAATYDAAHKACSALLEAQGLRPTSRGGHIVVRDAVTAQFADLPGGQVLRSFDRLRRRRNDIEYPGDDYDIDPDEVEEATHRAKEIVDFADELIDHLPVYRAR